MSEKKPFFRSVTNRTVARALRPALVWAYVAVVVAALLIAIVALVALLVAAVVWIFDRDLSIGGSVGDVVQYALWVAGPVTVGVAVAGAAYGSTESRSFPRTVAGTVVGVALGAALIGVGASGFAAGGLAAGWSIAIPADRSSRIAARGLPMVALAILATFWQLGTMADAGLWPLIAVLAVSPLLAALVVWAGDAAWAALAGRKPEPTTDADS